MKTTMNKKNRKTLITSLVGGVIAFLLILVFSSDVLAIIPKPLSIKGDPDAGISRFQLSPKQDFLDNNYLKDTLGSNFRVKGSSVFDNITLLGNAFFNQKLYVGFDSPGAAEAGGNNAELQINGNLVIQELAHPDCISDPSTCAGIPDTTLHANDFGVLVRGDNAVATPLPPTAINGTCNNSTQNACTTGTLNDIADSGTDYLWECTGENGGTTDSCSKAIPSTSTTIGCTTTPDKCLISGSETPSTSVSDTAGEYLWNCNTGGTTECSRFKPDSSTTLTIFDEGSAGEWTINSNPSGVSRDPVVTTTSTADSGSQSANGIQNGTNVVAFSLTNSTEYNLVDFEEISFAIKLKEPISTANYIFIDFMDGIVSSHSKSKLFNHGDYGFDANSTAWQTITIPVSEFLLENHARGEMKGFPKSFNGIEIYPFISDTATRSVWDGYYIDNVKIKLANVNGMCTSFASNLDYITSETEDRCLKGYYNSVSDTATEYKWECLIYGPYDGGYTIDSTTSCSLAK